MLKKAVFIISLVIVFLIYFSFNADAQKGRKFKHADRNKDGKVDKKELKMENRWENMQKKKIQADKNKDGVIDDKEREMVREKNQEAKSWWKKYADTDGNGVLDEDERNVWELQWRERIDLNGDGKISPEEKRLSWRHAKSRVNNPVEEKYDVNADGWLEQDEVKEMLKDKITLIKTKGNAKVDTEIEKQYDLDADGIIDKNEAKALQEDLD